MPAHGGSMPWSISPGRDNNAKEGAEIDAKK
jgi:hypothetical protein